MIEDHEARALDPGHQPAPREPAEPGTFGRDLRRAADRVVDAQAAREPDPAQLHDAVAAMLAVVFPGTGPRATGFVLVHAPFGTGIGVDAMRYASNIEPAAMVAMLQAILQSAGTPAPGS